MFRYLASRLAAYVAVIVFGAPQFDDPAKVATEGLRLLRDRALKPRLEEIELALASAGPDSDIDAISLLKERSEIHRQLRSPIGLPPTA